MTRQSRSGSAGASQHPAVLVTGATGFVGAALLRRLIAAGYQVRTLVRSTAQARMLASWGAQPVIGSIDDFAAVRSAIGGVAVAYHLAGRLLSTGVPEEEYRRTNVVGTELVIRAAREQGCLERLVYCSTTGVLGPTGKVPLSEDAPLAPSNIYEATKAEAEELVRRAMGGSLRAVIARPGLVYGPGDLHLLGLYRAVVKHQFRPIGSQPVWLHPIYIDDLVSALLICGELPQAVGECFHLAGVNSVTLESLAATIATAAGTRLPRGRIPLPAAAAVAAVSDRLPAPMRRASPLSRSRLAFLTHSRVYRVEKAAQVLNFSAATKLDVGISRTVQWYRSQGLLSGAGLS